MFFRLSLGGLAIGLAAGLGTIVLLKILNRRLSPEENVIQVVTLISISYLTYWVAEVLCLCSGIIATIGFGLTIKVVGESLINDRILTLHFFEVTGQLLNTLLFVLGGTLWGNVSLILSYYQCDHVQIFSFLLTHHRSSVITTQWI